MPEELLTLAEVLAATGLPKSSIYRRAGKDFPQREYLNGGKSRAIVWRKADIDAWLAGRKIPPRPASRIEGAHFRLPEYPNMQRAAAGVRRLALYGIRNAGITPTTGTRSIVHIPLTANREPASELRKLHIFFPDLRFTYHDADGIEVDLNVARESISDLSWLA
jgi:predicted DNA-binding transcriptional regulator AlpA